MRLRVRLRILREGLAWRYERAVWPLRHRWACFKEKWPLMYLSTHAEQVKALDARLKRQEREVKQLREQQRDPWPDVIEV